MSSRKSIIALLTAAVFALTPLSSCLAEEEMTVTDELLLQIATTAANSVLSGDNLNLYANINQASRADTLPEKFDLRDRGVVPPVRDQGDFGACWSFASIAACEISCLTDLGMTVEEFRQATGMDMDLSERHLAWFSSVPLQELEGMGEHDLTQVGEGRLLLRDDLPSTAHYSLGGFMGYASGMFASGIGPVLEEQAPYTANDGTRSLTSDWSLDESQRFVGALELKDSSILPSPARRNIWGRYVYNPIGTEAIKQELLRGRAVSIVFHADQAMNPETEFNLYRDTLVDMGVPEDVAVVYLRVRLNNMDEAELSAEEQKMVNMVRIVIKLGVPFELITDDVYDELYTALQEVLAEEEALAEAAAADDGVLTEEEIQQRLEAEAAAREAAERLGIDYDAYFGMNAMETQAPTEEQQPAEKVVYMNTETYAQYTWDANAAPDHAVTIVGYDDHYPASNFIEGHQPPADGAWIVRNSWGDSYGIDGYFYLSYYDRTILAPETFEFVLEADESDMSGVFMNEYDFMPAAALNAAAAQAPVYMANVYTMDIDAVLYYVSTMTANLDTNVTTAIYLLKEDAQSPIDGELLDIRTENFHYAGYHRIQLNQHYLLPKGTTISVVQTQRYDTDEGRYYALPYTLARNCEFARTYNTMMGGQELLSYGIEGKIGRGESFVCADGEWADWLDYIEMIKANIPTVNDFISFDNLSLKIYMYLPEEVNAVHTFGEPVPYAGGTVRLCTDCGYSLVER